MSGSSSERLWIVSASLRSVEPEADEDATEEWVAEIDRRSVAVENGTAQLVDAAAVHAQVRDTLRARRASRR
jgi:hypothetical protein